MKTGIAFYSVAQKIQISITVKFVRFSLFAIYQTEFLYHPNLNSTVFSTLCWLLTRAA